MSKRFLAFRIVPQTALTFALVFLASSATGDAPHAFSGEMSGAVRDSLIERTAPGAAVLGQCSRNDREPSGAGVRRHTFSGKIEGRVLDAVTGRGVPGVFVQVERDRDGRRCLSEPTDALGNYLLKVGSNDPDGEEFHGVTLALDYTEALGSGTLFPDRPLRIDFRLELRPTATVSGAIVDADTDMPVANALVAVDCLPACNGIPHPPVVTGPDGRYELGGVPFSPTGRQESGTPIRVTVPAAIAASRCYPLFPERVDVDDPDVIRDIRLKPTLPCGNAPFPPPPPTPPSCGVPPSTVDNNGRLVTHCLGPANETDLAVNPQNRLNIVSVAKDYFLGMDIGNTCGAPVHPNNLRVVWVGVYTSFDGGVTWNNDLLPGFPGDARPTGLPNQRCMSDPIIAFTPNGELYLAAIAWGVPFRRLFPIFALNPESVLLREFHLVLARSTDGGHAWEVGSIYRGFTTSTWPDKPALAIDPDYATNRTVYVGWDLVTEPSEIVSPKLTTVVNGEAISLEDVPGIGGFPAPAVLGDHSVVVTGLGSRRSDSIAASRRTMSGNWAPNGSEVGFHSFQTTGTTNGYRAVVVPTLAVDQSGGPTDGNVAIAWHTGGSGSSSLKVAYSSDLKAGGGTWIPVDPPAPFGALALDVLPRVAISASGKVAILYYEDSIIARIGPTPLTARYLSATGNGQPAWATPLTISAPFSPESMVHQVDSYKETGHAFIGDYVGLTFDSGGNPLATWADGRRNRSDIFFKTITITLIP